jgi:hypothetical protein
MLYDMTVKESLLGRELVAGIGRHVFSCGAIEAKDHHRSCHSFSWYWKFNHRNQLLL